MRSVVKCPGAVFLSLALAACGAPQPKPPSAPSPAASSAPAEASPPTATLSRPAPSQPAPPMRAHPGARYRIDPAESELRVLVYRAGAMASLGHNHVISTHALQGWATFEGDAAGAAFALTAAVADFAVDDPARRAEEGSDFTEDVTEEAKSGTRHNMLGSAVLDAADFPVLTIRSIAVAAAGAAGSYRATVALDVAGHASTLMVPFSLEASAHRLVARGELTVSQSAIGLTPYSILLGALKVQDDLRVKFKFVAVSG